MGENNRLETAMALVLDTQATMQQTIIVLTRDHVRDLDGFRREMADVRARLDRIEIIFIAPRGAPREIRTDAQ